jgi:16S rRNA (uracil1498-N3)-methyltransferase
VIDAAALATLRRAAAHVVVDDVDHPELDETAAHHLFRVLRLRDGEEVTVTDGRGGWCPCLVSAGTIEPSGLRQHAERRQPRVTIAFAIPKGDRPEWIVQKLTELGVDRIVLLHSDRSVVRWQPDRARRNLDKLQRVAVEALQQSRALWLPEIDGPTRAEELVRTVAVAEPGGRAMGPGDHSLAIGPEGGWSPAELEIAADRVDLGPTVFRVETAAVVAAARLVTGRG